MGNPSSNVPTYPFDPKLLLSKAQGFGESNLMTQNSLLA
jgi:hypothetical protein